MFLLLPHFICFFLYGTVSAFIYKNLTGTSGLSLIFQVRRESKKVARGQNFVV